MKHILNNISESEKNSIREQHKDKILVNTLNFQKNLTKKLGEVKPLIYERISYLSCQYFIYNKKGKLTYKGGGSFTDVDGKNFANISNLKNVLELGDGFGRGEVIGEYTYELVFGPTRRSQKGEYYLDLTDSNGGKATIYLLGCPETQNTQEKGAEGEQKVKTDSEPQNTQEKGVEGEQKVKTVVNKVSTEGLKNVLPSMITDNPFKGNYSGYVFGGVYNGVNYQWDCNGVEGMSGVRGMVEGEIITENNSFLSNFTKKYNKDFSDANPKGTWVGFYSQNTKFVCYMTAQNKPKIVYL